MRLKKSLNFFFTSLFIFISFSLFLFVLINLITAFDKGLILLDESFYLNLYFDPFSQLFTTTYFYHLGYILKLLSFDSLVTLRYLGLSLLCVSASFFWYSITYSRLFLFRNFFEKYIFLLICILSITTYYEIKIFSPSYNLFNLSLILIFISSIILNLEILKKTNHFVSAIISLITLYLILNKFTSGLPLILMFILIYYKSFNLDFIKQFFFYLIIFSLIFLYFNLDNIKNLIYFAFFQNEFTLKTPNLIGYILKYIPEFGYRLTLFQLKYVFALLFIFSFIFKKNINSILIVITFLHYLNKPFGNIAYFSFYLMIYNFLSYFLLKEKIFKKNLFLIAFGYLISVIYWFGSTMPLDKFWYLSQIFLMTSIYLIFVEGLFAFGKYKIYRNFTIFFLFILFVINTQRIVDDTFKKDYSFIEPLNKNNQEFKSIYNSKFFEDIKLREDLRNFIQDYQMILKQNNWIEGDLIIDATLKNPGLVLLANGKYLNFAWYIHHEDYLEISLKNLDHFASKPWIIISEDKNHLNVVLKYFDLENDFDDIGSIIDPKNKRKYTIMKPKNF